MTYKEFIASKSSNTHEVGMNCGHVSELLFDFQRALVRWAVRIGKSAIFADCGLGKTAMQLEWARLVPGRVLIVAPLAVSSQTVREAEKFGLDGVRYLKRDDGITPIVVTNYERCIFGFEPEKFGGVVLDESSILKSHTGVFRSQLIDQWRGTRWKLCCTATPAPNDFMELGNHAEFLGVMSRAEMLSKFFVHDGGETQKWRLKGHAENPFWRWLCSWAMMLRRPDDLGFDGSSFRLPELRIHEHRVGANPTASDDGFLFPMEARSLSERRDARRGSIAERVAKVAELVNSSDDAWICWCDLNAESDALREAIPGAVDVRGADDVRYKEDKLLGFANGSFRVLITKPKIGGFGMNWQHCSHMAFTGLSDSYEQFYQAVRRCWRFGQERPVDCHVVTSSTEGAVVKNIRRKDADAKRMADAMAEHMRGLNLGALGENRPARSNYQPEQMMKLPDWMIA